MASSWFSDVKIADPIEVFLLTDKCKADVHPDKVNLGVGGKLAAFLTICFLKPETIKRNYKFSAFNVLFISFQLIEMKKENRMCYQWCVQLNPKWRQIRR